MVASLFMVVILAEMPRAQLTPGKRDHPGQILSGDPATLNRPVADSSATAYRAVGPLTRPAGSGRKSLCPVYGTGNDVLSSPGVNQQGRFNFQIDSNEATYTAVYCANNHAGRAIWGNPNGPATEQQPPLKNPIHLNRAY